MKNLSLIILFIISCNITNAQIDREFWFAIPKETSGHGSLSASNSVSFKITAMSLDANVTISMPANSSFSQRTFKVPAGQTHIEVLASTYSEFSQIYNNNAAIDAAPISGKTNRGICISSDNDVIASYDYDNYYNRELFSLKGKNALGTDFYTPFQTIWRNDTTAYNPKPYSTIEIVATENNTSVTITPRAGQAIEGRPNSSAYTIVLNRGEAYSIRAKYANGKNHLAGLHITSDKKIAVTVNDDSVRQNTPTCRDIIGDQLVPTSEIGSEYLVMTGNKANTMSGMVAPYHYPDNVGEQIFVTAADPNSAITFKGKDGTLLYTTPFLNAGQSDYLSVDISNANMSSIYISATDPSKKFYVYHISGIGCELGAAIVPPLNDCTGSSEVKFYRSNTTNDFIVNLMIPYNNSKSFDDAAQAHNFFQLITYNTDGTVASSVPISGNAFEADVASGWAVLKMTERDFAARTTAGKTHSITNTKDFFHFGMQNNTNGQTGKYGYFSSFNVAKPEAIVSQTNASDFIACFGETFTFVASGGLSYTWHYGTPSGPPTYLSDPHSATPQVINAPAGSHNFYVEITNPKCFGTEIRRISYQVLPIVKADFEFDKTTTCAPDSVVITNKSIEADIYTWKIQKGSGPEEIYVPKNNTQFKVPSENLTTDPIVYTFKLLASSSEGCADQITKTITVYPGIQSVFETDKVTACSSDNIVFTNKTTNATSYTWQKQIGSGPALTLNFTPPHSAMNFIEPFRNPSATASLNIKYSLIAENSYGCKDTSSKTIEVFPEIAADFIADKSEGCNPFTVSFTNESKGSGLSYTWWFGDGTAFNASNITHVFTNNSSVDKMYAVKLFAWRQSMQCTDTATQYVTVFANVNADFTIDKTAGCTPLLVNIIENSTGDVIRKIWDIDGVEYLNDLVQHTFTNTSNTKSSKEIKLVVSNRHGCKDSTIQNIEVYPKLRADFSVSDTAGYSPLNIRFTNNTSDNNATAYWVFGDGNNSAAISPSHEFLNNSSSPIKYEVFLYTTNETNCKDTASRTIRVKPRASAIHPQISIHEGISLYPIPAGNEVTIEYTLENPANVIIELFSTDGKLINSKSEYKLSGKNKDILELDGINGKAFLVKLRHNDKIRTIKGIKE